MVARVEGNQTTQFEYDFDNRLVKITYPNGSVVQFGYDGLGRRVFRQEGASVRYFYYDGDKIIAEREGNSWVVRYLLGLKSCGHVVSGQIRVYHADRLGSVRWVTDGGQNIVASYVYEGFGKIVGKNGGDGGAYQFCGLWGYRNDWDAGLLHVGARYYEVETGRWVQKDPLLGDILNPQTLNRYGYCQNNPINAVDPTGNKTWRDEARGIIAAIAVGIGVTLVGGFVIGTGGIGGVIVAGLVGAASGAAYYGYSHLYEEWDWSDYAETIVSSGLISAGIVGGNLACTKLPKLATIAIDALQKYGRYMPPLP
ncbi:MAG: hypothetical protein NOOUEUKL_001612 [Candidatus Fervidibacter sp.]